MFEFFGRLRIPDLDRHRGKLLVVTGVRIIFFAAILIISVIYQLKQSLFFNTDSLYPLFILLFTAFILNSIYLYFFEKTQALIAPTAALFGFDAIAISSLVLITGNHQSIFLFLYLVNIILCSLIFQRKGAFVIALFTSLCFAMVLILGPEIYGQTLYFTVGLNNLAFFTVAGLSGYLSEQMNFMGEEISAQRKDLKALRDLNKIIVENINSGLLTVTPDFKVVFANRAAQRILDQGLEGTDLNRIFVNIGETILEKEERKDARFQVNYKKRDGEKLKLGFSVSPLLDEQGRLSGHIVIFQDLTEILRMEEAMRRQDKLAAVGKLAAGIAHEIRNPLASISGSVELLKSMLPGVGGDQGRLMDISLREISRLNQLITEFLEFVRPEERKQDPVSLDQLLDEIMDMLPLNANLPKVDQKRDLNSGAYILGDRNKLKQVFLNLMINAYQAMADSKTKTISATTRFEDDSVVVSIRDTGHGMSTEVQKRLFEPFFTTKPKGTGLGLAVAHKILETHRADIFVESHEDKGTEFTIRFNEAIKQGATPHESQNTGS